MIMVMLTLRFVHFTSLSELWESGSGCDVRAMSHSTTGLSSFGLFFEGLF